jgi:hypothetical protein
MKPQAYNKSKMVCGMERAVAKAQSEAEQMYELFFEKPPQDINGVSHWLRTMSKTIFLKTSISPGIKSSPSR